MDIKRTTVVKEATKTTENAIHAINYTTIDGVLAQCVDNLSTTVQHTAADGQTMNQTMPIGSITWQNGVITCNLTSGTMIPFASEFEDIIKEINVVATE